MPSRLSACLASSIAFLLLMAAVAEARIFRMSGNWSQRRGPTIQVPFGGVGAIGAARVSATGSAPASLTIPPNQFAGTGMTVIALPVPSLIQFTTSFSLLGPVSAGVMRAGPKSTRPANFAFCPGAAANPTCPTAAPGPTVGTKPGRATYTAGPNQFGGTMQMLVRGGSWLVSIEGGKNVHRRITGATSGTQVVGGSYARTTTRYTSFVNFYTTGALCAGGGCVSNGPITMPGYFMLTQMTSTPSFNVVTGLPWTTGMVTVVQGTRIPTTYSTFEASGSDNRTPLGSGNVMLVAGGLTHPSLLGNFTALDTVQLTMSPRRNLPSMGPAGLATLAASILLGAVHLLRRTSRRSR